MAIAFPAAQAAFADKLCPLGGSFYDDEPIETSRLADGTVIKASLGAALWRGRFNLARRKHEDALAVEALLSVVKRAGASFLIYDRRLNGPQRDPGGVLLGAATPSIHTLAASNRELRVTGLPAGYVLSAGDMIGWLYGANPVRYALHRLVSGAVASGSGLTPLVEVTPRIRPGSVTGTAVQLVRPVCKAVILPDPEYGGFDRRFSDGASFDFIQTLR